MVELGFRTDAIVIAMIARVDPMKDHGSFLAAAAMVALQRPNAMFVLIGQDTQRMATELVARGLRARCRLLGLRRDLDSLLPGLDLLVLSSLSDGFPNVLAEAMACGVPCVSTDVGEARRIIGETGRIVQVKNPTALAAALLDLIDAGADARARMGAAARARIVDHYSMARMVGAYQRLYADWSRVAAG